MKNKFWGKKIKDKGLISFYQPKWKTIDSSDCQSCFTTHGIIPNIILWKL